MPASSEPAKRPTGDTQFLADVGLQIRLLRVERRMGQRALAAASGISRNFMGAIERGDHAANVVLFHYIAKALRVPIAALFERVDRSVDGYTAQHDRRGD